MKSKMSFINRGIFLNDLRGLAWTGLTYLGALCVFVPLNILLIYSSGGERDLETTKNIVLAAADVQGILIIAFPVLVAILLFRYLHVKGSTVFVHSLPVSREVLFRTHTLAGTVLLAVPLVITALLTWGLQVGLSLDRYFSGQDILVWLGLTFLMDMLIYMAAVFTGTATGLSTVHAGLTYILLFLPTGLSMLVLYNLEFFLHGFVHNYAYDATIARLSPLATVLEMSRNRLTVGEIWAYSIAAVVFYLLAGWLYRKRPSEAATQAIAFRQFRPIFKYGVIFCFMLLGGIYFKSSQYPRYWVFFGFLAGSLLGYLVAEVILKKSLRIFGGLKGYGVYAGVVIILLAGMGFDLTGYEEKVPAFADVQQVYFGDVYYHADKQRLKDNTYYNPDNIRNIETLHRRLIVDKELLRNDRRKSGYSARTLMFAYKLKSGEEIIRGYEITMADYAKYLKPIYESAEYKSNHYAVLGIQPARVDKITIIPERFSKKAVIVNPQHIAEAVQILQREIRQASYAELTDPRGPWARINLLLDNGKTASTAWNKNFSDFEKWLKLRGYYNDARLLPQDVDYVTVQKYNRNGEQFAIGAQEKSKPGRLLKITDKVQIEQCLQAAIVPDGEPDYFVAFCAGDRQETFFFAADSLPGFVGKFFAGR